ncbi:hypothetical protein EXN66_Car009050 [Channa argus]|uniref:Uncharacterized protein n=1 Tax=Channa argus TaxID=215402 RepID=A0A6G1PTA3_CHAAH|nr:hypothetical protein EXN66_Car009050 [Channa argus]
MRAGPSTKPTDSPRPLIALLILIRPELQPHPSHRAVLSSLSHSLINQTYWPQQYKGLPLELTRAHLNLKRLTSSPCAIIDISNRRCGEGADERPSAAPHAELLLKTTDDICF